MGAHVDQAKKRLFDAASLRVSNIKLYPGSNREATPEQIAETINKSLAHIEAGDFEVANIDDN